ncbi:MAG: undecaprenyl-diphosphatase UppP [Candidatus Paceibacterota bacterium]|jgi:undecaprenyl-diphosphatase
MNFIQAIILGVVQGITEFLPISSSGHLIIARDVLHIQTPSGLAVDAVLQLATILAVGLYFWRDILRLIQSAVRMILRKNVFVEDAVWVKGIIIGTIPAAILGLLLEKYMDTVFRSALLVAVTFIVGAVVMLCAEKYAAAQKSGLTVKKSLYIGLFQVLALVPGMSRSGMTISGGLCNGLSREEAARFSFLLSFPIILASGLKKMLDLYQAQELGSVGMSLALGFAVAFIVGMLCIHLLIKYLKNHSLKIFAWYRIVVAVVVIGAVIFFK